jgi:hypothetical protein
MCNFYVRLIFALALWLGQQLVRWRPASTSQQPSVPHAHDWLVQKGQRSSRPLPSLSYRHSFWSMHLRLLLSCGLCRLDVRCRKGKLLDRNEGLGGKHVQCMLVAVYYL